MTRELDSRARAYAKKMCDEYGDEEQIWSDSYNTYLEIAAEQEKADEADYTEQMRQLNEEWKDNLRIKREMLTEKAWEWVKKNLFPEGAMMIEIWEGDFFKAMEE